MFKIWSPKCSSRSLNLLIVCQYKPFHRSSHLSLPQIIINKYDTTCRPEFRYCGLHSQPYRDVCVRNLSIKVKQNDCSTPETPVTEISVPKVVLRNIGDNLEHSIDDIVKQTQLLPELDEKSVKLLTEDSEFKAVEPLTPLSLAKYYSRLAKLRLTGLVVLTTLAGYYMGLHSAIDPTLLTATLLGTALTSGSATTLNQYLEIPFDSQMVRTRNRPLIVGQLTPLHAIVFAAVSGVTGLTLLASVNPLTAILGASNLILYAFIYTPMKRAHIANTWIGAIVGAIPPVMGFTAANNCIDMSAILVGLVLYSWQFPHFNALSWNMRHDYARAGYRMMSVTEPNLCLNTSLRHSSLIVIYSTLMCTCLTTWTFAVTSLPFNAYLIYLTWRFWSNPNSSSSRKLFRYSLIHLPAIILLMLISKRRQSNSNHSDIKNDENLSSFNLNYK